MGRTVSVNETAEVDDEVRRLVTVTVSGVRESLGREANRHGLELIAALLFPFEV